MDKPKVTVVVPIYNIKNKYLEQCIQSLLMQTLKEIEILLISDGTKEENIVLCENYVQKDKRIHLIKKENEGVSATRNLGIKLAKGEYITFVDADDWIEPDMCQLSYERAQKTQSDVVVWRFYSEIEKGALECYFKGKNEVIFSSEESWKLQAMVLDALFFEEVQVSLLGAAWGKLYATSFLKDNKDVRFPENMTRSEDEVMAIKAFQYVKNVLVIDELLYHYRQHGESVTKKININYVKKELERICTIKSYLNDMNISQQVKNAFYAMVRNSYIHIMQFYVTNPEIGLNYRRQLSFAKEILTQEEYSEAFTDINCEKNIKKKILYYCVKNRWYPLIVFIVKIYGVVSS